MNPTRQRAAMLATGLAASAFVIAAPPAMAGYVQANCAVSIISRAPAIQCLSVTGGEARARANCVYAPDTYTRWVRSYQSATGGKCLFSARGAILQTRAF